MLCEYDIIIRSTWVWRGIKYNNNITVYTIRKDFIDNGSYRSTKAFKLFKTRRSPTNTKKLKYFFCFCF